MLLPILICISGWLSEPDAAMFERAAHDRGYATYFALRGESLEGQDCDATIVRSDDDTTRPRRIGFDDRNARRDYTRRTITQARAYDIMLAWGQYERAIVAEKATGLGFVADGYSDAYDFLAELPAQLVSENAAMLMDNSPDPADRKHKRRGTVLGKWHQLKKELWSRHKEAECTQLVPF